MLSYCVLFDSGGVFQRNRLIIVFHGGVENNFPSPESVTGLALWVNRLI